MRIIEFAGPSGVGKSAIYNQIQIDSFTPNPKPTLDDALFGTREHPFVDVIEKITKNAIGPRVQTRRSFLYRSLYKYVLAANQDGLPMIVDGGLVQRGLAVELMGSGALLKNLFWKKMPLPDMIVFVTADPMTIIGRNIVRGGSHDRSSLVNIAVSHFEAARSALGDRGANIVEIDSRESVEANAERVCGFIKTLSG